MFFYDIKYVIYLIYPEAHIIQSSTLDSVTAETYLLESKFSLEREKRPRTPFSIAFIRSSETNAEWWMASGRRSGKGRLRLFARLFGT